MIAGAVKPFDVIPASAPERPWLFGLLIAPMAVLSNGVIGGALAYLLRQQGVGPARESSILAFLTLPQTIYFLWSPLTDFWFHRRTWLMIAAAASAAALFAAFREPSLAASATVGLIFLSACLGQIIVASCGGMMGTLQRESVRRRASSFYQAGSLAFGAVAILVLVGLSGRLALRTLGWITAAMIALPAVAALLAPRQQELSPRGFRETRAILWREFKTTFLRVRAIPYLLLVLFPMGSGAMIQLLPGLAVDYHIDGAQVAWINGVAGALLMAAGALATTLLPARARAGVIYVTISLANEAALAILLLGPLRPGVYFAGTVLFLFTIGGCYAGFTAVILEFLGRAGMSGSGRYSIINSLGNIPVAYMTYLDGRGYARWGARGLPGIDAVVGGLGGLLLLAYLLWGTRGSTPVSESAS
ncbi:MAG TPA: MFS transporter [Acidobacteriaceae bacterium]|nr:MFS transporter [Acidobacteriaceae bacterium]